MFGRSLIAAVSVGVIGAGLVPAAADGARVATPATFHKLFASTKAGSLQLASGDYGEFRGAAKSRRVTLRPAPGASPRMSLRLSGARNLRFSHLTIDGAEIRGASRNITIDHSRFTDVALVDTTSGMVRAHIVFDRDRFLGINVCDTCYEGRLTVHGNDSQRRPVGVTVKRSLFGHGGEADGMQIGAYGVRVLNNEFADIRTVSAVHTDALQLYGQSHTVIRGNWFHNVTNGVVGFDGTNHEVIEDNVIDTDVAVTLVSDDGSVVRHNTMTGNMRLGYKPEYPNGRGTVITNNVFRSFDDGDPGNRWAEESHNLVSTGPSRGAGDIRARPRFVGGASPRTLRGFALARGSRGFKSASDGSNRGAAIGRVGPGAGLSAPKRPKPKPKPVKPKQKHKKQKHKKKTGGGALRVRWSSSPAHPRIEHPVTLRASRQVRRRARSCVWDFDGYEQHRGCVIHFTFHYVGDKHITLTATDRNGHRHRRAHVIHVSG
jgi:hypothetical protein